LRALFAPGVPINAQEIGDKIVLKIIDVDVLDVQNNLYSAVVAADGESVVWTVPVWKEHERNRTEVEGLYGQARGQCESTRNAHRQIVTALESAEPQMRTKKIIAVLPKGIHVSNERFSSNTSEDNLELKFEASARQVTLSNGMQMLMQYTTVYVELLKVGTIRKVDNAPTASNNHALDLLLQGTVGSLASSTAGPAPMMP
jgi:hypothetical protein